MVTIIKTYFKVTVMMIMMMIMIMMMMDVMVTKLVLITEETIRFNFAAQSL